MFTILLALSATEQSVLCLHLYLQVRFAVAADPFTAEERIAAAAANERALKAYEKKVKSEQRWKPITNVFKGAVACFKKGWRAALTKQDVGPERGSQISRAACWDWGMDGLLEPGEWVRSAGFGQGYITEKGPIDYATAVAAYQPTKAVGWQYR